MLYVGRIAVNKVFKFVRYGSVKIFVGNIRDGTTTDQLRELFECYGKVVESDVLSGFGFIVSISVNLCEMNFEQ